MNKRQLKKFLNNKLAFKFKIRKGYAPILNKQDRYLIDTKNQKALIIYSKELNAFATNFNDYVLVASTLNKTLENNNGKD